ncbi:hypothetical protein [Limnobacter sp.]|uniref:hypothetical protein n=1 Tax=Limnobacter sp. TaxID=2003368 RepID=UPI00351759DD
MLVALPIQGMAQASMFACHLQDSGKASFTEHHQHGEAGQEHHAHTEHHAHGEPSSDDSSPIVKAMHGCCHCAPSCAAVVVPNTLTKINEPLPNGPVLAMAQTPPHSADSRRLERPPKSLSV